MQAIVLNGMSPDDQVTESVYRLMINALESRGWQITSFDLYDMEVTPCGGCFGCWIQTPGRCLSSQTDEIARTLIQSDVAVYVTPVTFGGYSSELKKVVDHMIGLILPQFRQVAGETHHQPRYSRYPSLLAVGTLTQPDPESEGIFVKLVERNGINMAAPAWAAGVITQGQDEESARTVIEGLLAEMEVTA
jgi:multimeric flavodoxin WrbA